MTSRYSIVGMNFQDSEGFVAGLPSGKEAVLIREPHNGYDPLAVAVWIDGRRVGYVPKKQNRALAQFIDQAGHDLSTLAMDAASPPTGSRYVRATFVRSANSSYPMVEVE